MFKRMMLVLAALAVLFTMGCSTRAKFTIPEDSQLYLGDRTEAVEFRKDGKTVVTRPYAWPHIAGIPYRLEKDGEVIQEGKVPAGFRVACLFWPPVAIAYWPVGFSGGRNYDLTTGEYATTKDADEAQVGMVDAQ